MPKLSTPKPDAMKFLHSRIKEILECGLSCFITHQLMEIGHGISGSGMTDEELHQEQRVFFDFVQRLARKRPNEKIPLCFYGRTIKVGVIMVKANNANCIDYYSRELDRLAEKGINTIYLLAIGRVNLWVARLIADIFAHRSTFKVSAARENFRCGSIRHRSIIRLTRNRDVFADFPNPLISYEPSYSRSLAHVRPKLRAKLKFRQRLSAIFWIKKFLKINIKNACSNSKKASG